MNKLWVVIVLSITIGCASSQTSFDELSVQNNKFYKIDKVYTGSIVTKFESGKISNKLYIENGIPSGNWIAYGYDGEEVQTGNYKAVTFDNLHIQNIKDIVRINVQQIVEDSVIFYDVFVVAISTKQKLALNPNNKFSKSVLKTLKIKGFNLDSEKIDSIFLVNIEFSP